MGLVGGNAQAAQGLSMLIFPFVFVSSAYVPVESMPGWMQPIAEHQPVTYMVNSVRALSLGDEAGAVFAHGAGWYAVRAVLWSVGDRRRLPPPGAAQVRDATLTPPIGGLVPGVSARGPRSQRAQAVQAPVVRKDRTSARSGSRSQPWAATHGSS